MGPRLLEFLRSRWLQLTCVCLSGFATAAFVFVPLARLDGLPGIVGILLRPDTEYAPGYTDGGFLRLRAGMTPLEVRALLGVPLKVTRSTERQEERWFYSRSPNDTHYRCRVVEFQRSVVAGTHAEFYLD